MTQNTQYKPTIAAQYFMFKNLNKVNVYTTSVQSSGGKQDDQFVFNKHQDFVQTTTKTSKIPNPTN